MATDDAGSTRRVSMADVAAAAGVSGQTVSRVVNDSPRVDPQTRARVTAAMTRLGYRPHRAARALRTGRTQAIGVVATTLASVGNARLLQAVVEAASSHAYAVVVATPGPGEGVSTAFERLREQGVDGAVVLNEATPLARAAALPAGLDLVVVDSAPDPRFTVVGTDHAAGAAALTRHLLTLGHDTVHHLAGPAHSHAAVAREQGWREALRAAGRPVPPVVRTDWSADDGHRAALVLHEASGDSAVTAVSAANDQTALGALRAFAGRGLDVPRDISVAGFDDIAEARQFRPPLTTVRQDFTGVGAAAVAALTARIEQRPTAAVHLVAPRLVVRESTAPPAVTRRGR